MKITRIGWTGKTQKPGFVRTILADEQIQIFDVYTKGKRSDWASFDWPPRKVRVTVEDVK